jgi:hypothetical protein
MFDSNASTSTKLLVGLISTFATIYVVGFALVYLVNNLLH